MNVQSGKAAHAPSKRAVSIDEEAPRGAPSSENRPAAIEKDEALGDSEVAPGEAAPGAAGSEAEVTLAPARWDDGLSPGKNRYPAATAIRAPRPTSRYQGTRRFGLARDLVKSAPQFAQ
jgi:hypothetical protein